MRLLLAAILILALAGPILRPSALPPGRGPEVIVVDTGWAAASSWGAIKAALLAEIERDQRAEMSVVLVPTARGATGNPVVTYSRWLAPVMGGLIWPLVAGILKRSRDR